MSDNIDLLLKNCHLISPDVELSNAAVAVNNGMIVGIFTSEETLPSAREEIDADGKMTTPGFIDIHFHGRSGFDFSDGSDAAMTAIGNDKLKEGVTCILPTTLTLPEERLTKSLQAAAAYIRRGEPGARLPGVHLEGPFINSKCLGAQNPEYVRKPDIAEVKRLNALVKVLKVSFAVECEDGGEFVRELFGEGIVPSCVHSAAGYKDFQKAHDLGLVNLTHFCNQMTPLHHRDIGLVGAGLLHDEVFVEIICDKIHLSPEMIQLIFKVKNIEKIMLITDAMSAAGLQDGDFDIGGLKVLVKDGAARLASSGALAGSTLQLNKALKNVREITKLPLSQLIKTTSWNQARSLGLPGLGRIAPGYHADILILDGDFNPLKVFVGGREKLSIV